MILGCSGLLLVIRTFVDDSLDLGSIFFRFGRDLGRVLGGFWGDSG